MVKFKLCYDESKCIGATACTSILPQIFKMNEENIAVLVSSKKEKGVNVIVISDELKDKAEDAIKSCPTAAIYMEKISED
jgi:ferredoxin